MSNKLYNELCDHTMQKLKDLIYLDEPHEPLPPITDRQCCVQRTTSIYLTYVKIANELNTCYEQMLHPQKRRQIRLFLDCTIGRALELKDELVKLEFSDFQFFDNVLPFFQMIPSDTDLPIPRYFLEEKTAMEKEKNEWIRNALDKFSSSEDTQNKSMSVEEAAKLIQIHERARQGKQTFLEMQDAQRKEDEELRKFVKKKPKPKISPEEAAVLIQKMWRGFFARKTVQTSRHDELVFLKMCLPEKHDGKSYISTAQEISKHRNELQNQQEECYQKLLVATREWIEKDVIPEMAEKMEDDIREYFHDYKNKNENFPIFPTDEEGGSSVFWPETGTSDKDDNVITASKEVKSDKAKDKSGKGKDKKGEKDKGKKGDKQSSAEAEGFALKPSKFVPDLKQEISKYSSIWDEDKTVKMKKRPFEFDPSEHDPLVHQQLHSDDPDHRLIERELMKEYETSVRHKVDALMRIELAELTKALLKDKGKKGGKKGKKGGGKKGGKKGGGKKGGKAGKGKKEKDLTPDRSFESLIEELAEQNILKDFPKVRLSEIIGSHCSFGSVMQKEYKKDPDPCIGDIRRVVKEVCILPMVSSTIHSKGPYAKSVLFAGSHGTGKKTFVNAICTEIGATLFDLSAANIAGKYPGKQGLSMLMHLMSKVGRRVQPTVIFIGDAEKTFLKKVPKTDETEPKRLKKDLPKFLKGIGADDRILLIGTTRTPFDVDLKGLGACYQKSFYLANPDFNCRRALWIEMILQNKGVISPHLDVTTLCKVSEGYMPFHIKSIIQKVLTLRRISYQEKYPLVLTEFTSLLPFYTPVYNEEHQAYKTWLSKMPLGKKREKLLKEEEEGGEGEAKKKDKKKK